MEVTYTGVTVILEVALRFVPSVVVAVMVAFPIFFAVTNPLETDAIVASLVFQVTVLFSRSLGSTVASSCNVLPKVKDLDVSFNVMDVAYFDFTVTEQVAFRFVPSVVIAVMVAVPAFNPFIVPFDTVAMVLSELVQLIFLFVVFSGRMVAFNV